MLQRNDHQMNHPDDHIRHNDEAFQYQGTLPTELVTEFVKENQPKIAFLQGFIAVGKTRTSKEFARLLAERFRGQRNGAKVHTFLFDLRRKSVETLLSDILRVFKDKVQGWKYGNIENVDQLSDAFGKETDRVFILVLDNVDRVHDKERPTILDFIEELVSGTGNVHLVVTSRSDVNLVRISTQVMKHPIKPLERKYAKELLKETSGNPKGLDKFADNIVDLMGGLPLALMLAGNEMNKKSTQLPYTPEEFVALMTDSLSLSLDLENVPTEDRIISRVIDIVKENWTVLKKLVIALDYPQMFDTGDLKEAMVATSGSSECDWQIKKTLLLVLRRSVYGLNREGGSAVSLESAPLLIEVLKETFCQMTSKDGFLRDFNKCLVNMLDDTSYLMRSGAKELRQAEFQLLRNQKGPKVTPQELRELRTNVITKAFEFLGTLEVDAKRCTKFQTQCIQIQNEWERVEAHKVPPRVGIQETRPVQKEQPVICCGSPPRILPDGLKEDLEACVSPTTSQNIALPSMKDINQANDSSKTTVIEAENDSSSEETKKADVTNPQKKENGDIEHSGRELRGSDEITSSSTGNKNLHMQAVSPDSSCSGKTVVTEESSTSDAEVTQDNNVSTAFQSPCNDHTKSVPSNVSTDDSSVSLDLCKSFDKSTSLDAPSLPGSLHCPDCREPTQESASSHVTYSALPTLPDNHVLTRSPNLERKKGDDQQHIDNSISPTGMSTKEAVESEFDWEHGDNEEVGESTEEAIADKKPCNAETQADRKKDHPGGETKREVRKLPQLHGVQTTSMTTRTTATKTTTTKGTSADGPRQSHPKVRRNETRGQGILGSTPSSSSSSSLHSPTYPQDPSFLAHYNPVLDQNTSFPPPVDRRYVYGNQGIREQCQMLPGPFMPPNVQRGSYHDPPYKGGSGSYNQFEREYNDLHYQESYYNCSGNTPTPRFTKNSIKYSQTPQAHEPAFLRDGSYSDFQPQGPVYGYPQPHGLPFQKHVSTPPPRLQTQSSSSSFSQACWPPHHSNVSSPNSSFLPQGPSCRLPQAYGPPFPGHGSTIPPSSQAQSLSDTFSQAQGPPLQSNVSSPPSSFRPRGPPSLNAPSPPGSLRTNGFHTPPRHMNGPPNRPHQRDYGHDQYGQHQHGQHQQGQHQQGQLQQRQHQQGQHQQRQHQHGQHRQEQHQQGQHQQGQHQQGQHQQGQHLQGQYQYGQHQQGQHQQGQHQHGQHQQGQHQQGQHLQGQYLQQPRYGFQRNCHYY